MDKRIVKDMIGNILNVDDFVACGKATSLNVGKVYNMIPDPLDKDRKRILICVVLKNKDDKIYVLNKRNDEVVKCFAPTKFAKGF